MNMTQGNDTIVSFCYFCKNSLVMKRISKWLLTLVIVGFSTVSTLAQKAKDIVILYENDVHCSIDGYTRLAGLRDAIAKADTWFVGIVSCGDFAAGADVGKNSILRPEPMWVRTHKVSI